MPALSGSSTDESEEEEDVAPPIIAGSKRRCSSIESVNELSSAASRPIKRLRYVSSSCHELPFIILLVALPRHCRRASHLHPQARMVLTCHQMTVRRCLLLTIPLRPRQIKCRHLVSDLFLTRAPLGYRNIRVIQWLLPASTLCPILRLVLILKTNVPLMIGLIPILILCLLSLLRLTQPNQTFPRHGK